MTFSAQMSCVMIMSVVAAMRRKRGSNVTETVMSFAETLVAYEAAKSFVYIDSYLHITLGKKLFACKY